VSIATIAVELTYRNTAATSNLWEGMGMGYGLVGAGVVGVGEGSKPNGM